MQVKDKVFILKTTRYGDADLIVNCLNAQGARISFFARSALKSKKRFGGGVLEPTHYIEAMYENKQGSSGAERLHTLKEAHLIQGFSGLRTDYERIELALYLLKLVSDVVKEGEIDSADIFNLLGNALRAAETTSRLDLLRLHFEVKLLSNQGVLPVEPEERHLLSAPISAHESLTLPEAEWNPLKSRVKRVLGEYLRGES